MLGPKFQSDGPDPNILVSMDAFQYTLALLAL